MMPPLPFLTIFSAPKSFANPHVATIQRNAIQSWKHLGPEVEVFLVGNEPGLPEAAAEYGIKLLPDVSRNELGTPLVSSIFALARQASFTPLLAYVNADILLLPDFVEAARRVSQLTGKFLLIGQRWDLDVRELLSFPMGWDQQLAAEVKDRGRLHLPAGSDYFIFPRELFTEMPEFTIGRAGWDNWMIFQARQQGWPVVDGTPSLMAIHQDHDYSHLPGGKPHYELPESHKNTDLAGGPANLYMVLDADKQLVNGRLHSPKPDLLRTLRRAEVWLMPPGRPRRGPRWFFARRLRRWRRSMTGSL